MVHSIRKYYWVIFLIQKRRKKVYSTNSSRLNLILIYSWWVKHNVQIHFEDTIILKVHYYHLKWKFREREKSLSTFKLFDCLSNFCCFINVDHLVEDVNGVWCIAVVSVHECGILSFTKVFKMFSKVKRAKIDEDATDALNQ